MPDHDIKPSDITPEAIYRKRRQYIKMGLWASLASSLPFTAGALNRDSDGLTLAQRNAPDWLKNQLSQTASADPKQPGHSTDETLTPYQDATSYNNFYEFGMGKKDPYYYASQFDPHPWTVEITGLVNKPGSYHLEDLVKPHKLQERIYRLRCVEAWSMVIPWIGFPLADLIKQVEPMAGARYVAFRTLEDRTRLRGQRSFFSTINWPYREGLRLDEATHPLTLMAVGMYGKVLPGQNGAPLRLVVPWKYGFKSIKSIVSIEFTATRPE
ncbi:MAG: protein-methionine-sulfoxide reductase catalytic subunit MsrP, partial [Gammaproteobacteria bacterium]